MGDRESEFRLLARSECSRADLLEKRFALQHWRRSTGVLPGAGEIQETPDRIRLPIHPQKRSRWNWKRWSTISPLSEHIFMGAPEAGEVLYRGIRLRAGDLIVGDQGSALSGLFAGVSEQPSLAAHVAVFVVLEREGHHFPAVIECYKYGVRAIPLSTYLAPAFTTYAEIHRLRNAPAGWSAKLAAVARALLDEPHGYDFVAQDTDRRYLTCSTLVSVFLERTGVAPTRAGTRYGRGIVKNMAKLGIEVAPVLTPTDFVQDPRFEYVACLDHGTLASHVTRALVVRELREILGLELFDPRRLPLRFQLKSWAIGQVRKGSVFGRLLRRFAGFTEDNFPGGPDRAIAMVGLVERWARPMIDACEPEVTALIARDRPFSLRALAEEPRVKSLVFDAGALARHEAFGHARAVYREVADERA